MLYLESDGLEESKTPSRYYHSEDSNISRAIQQDDDGPSLYSTYIQHSTRVCGRIFERELSPHKTFSAVLLASATS